MKKVKLGELADVIVSGVDKKTKDGETPVKLCNFVDVYHNWAITSEMCDSFMEASARDAEIDKFSLFKGQVAITKDSETRFDIGIPTYIADDFDGVLLGYHCALITPNQEVLNGKYLNALLHSDYAKEYFANNATGSGQRYTISEDTIKAFPVPLIPIEEQVKIGNYLFDIDRKISCNKKQNDLLEKLAKQLYDYWFVQFDFPDENGKPYKSSGGAMVYNEQLKREIPEGWEVKRIGECITTNRGHSYTGENLSPNGIPMINLASFTPNGKYNPNGIKFYEGKISKDKQLQPYDLVICNTQQTAIDFTKDIIGRALLVPDIFEGNDIISSHHVTTIKCNTDNLRFYFYYLFNSDFFHKYISKHTNGTNILGLIMSGLTDYKTFIPEESVLKPFASFVMDIHSKMCNNIKNTSNMNAYFKEMLPLLITGQAKL